MWMMGCSDGSGCGYNMSDSFNNPRKLRPLFPKPSTSNPYVGNGHAAATSTTHPCFNRIHGTDLFLLNHHHLVTEQSRRDVNVTTPTMVSSRWNPTPEQLHTLEELYRGGTRTPSAEQIQHITAQLRRYGKIEGKNVFYWFQNHKARERQKRRRQTEELIEHKESSDIEVDQEEAKNWGLSTTNMNSSHIHQDSVSMQRAVRTEESRTDGWIHMGEREFQHRRRSLERWQKMHLTYSPPITFTTPTTPTTTNTATTTTTSTVYTNNLNFNMPDKECRESHTLELFPIRNHETSNSNNAGKDTQGVSTSGTTYKFFEFL